QTGGQFVFTDSAGEHAIPMTYLARQPGLEAGGMGLLYANATEGTILRSSDGGAAWDYLVGSPDDNGQTHPFHDGCLFDVPAWAPEQRYASCHPGHDVAGIASWDIFARGGPIQIDTIFIHTGNETSGANFLASAANRPGIVYAGEPRGLIKLEA